MKPTNLKQTSVTKPRTRFQFRDQPPSGEATASHRRSRLDPREFAENSRIFTAFRPAEIELHNSSSLVNQLFRTLLDNVRNRVVGILFGLIVTGLIFQYIWPERARTEARSKQ
jgi:hypothetical protein